MGSVPELYIWHVCKGLAARESQQINNFYNDMHITVKMSSINTTMNVRVELYHNYALGKLIFTTRQWASIKIFKLGVPVTYYVRTVLYLCIGEQRSTCYHCFWTPFSQHLYSLHQHLDSLQPASVYSSPASRQPAVTICIFFMSI
jgi:hypothetical protein